MKNTFPILITVVVLILVIIAVYIVGRVQGKARGRQGQSELPNNGEGIPTGWSPSALSDRLYAVLKGANWSTRVFFYDERDVVLSDLLNLATDDMFAAVSNDFLARHGKGKETLWKWIQDEYWIDDTIYEGLEKRFNQLSPVQ